MTWAEWVESIGYQHSFALSNDGKVVMGVSQNGSQVGRLETQGDADITVIKPKDYVYISFPQ